MARRPVHQRELVVTVVTARDAIALVHAIAAALPPGPAHFRMFAQFVSRVGYKRIFFSPSVPLYIYKHFPNLLVMEVCMNSRFSNFTHLIPINSEVSVLWNALWLRAIISN